MFDKEALQEAVSYLAYTVEFHERTGEPLPNQARHTKVVLDALAVAGNQVANVVELLPLQNPELIDFGYSIEAKDILEAINKEMR